MTKGTAENIYHKSADGPGRKRLVDGWATKYTEGEIKDAIAKFAPYPRHISAEHAKCTKSYDALVLRTGVDSKLSRDMAARIAKLERHMRSIEKLTKGFPTP